MQGLDFIRFCLKDEIHSALLVASGVVHAQSPAHGEEILLSIGQGRTGHGEEAEVSEYLTWLEETQEHDVHAPNRCWVDIETLFSEIWQGEPLASEAMLTFTDDPTSNYQKALAAVVFEYTVRHRMALILPLSRVSTHWKDQNLAKLLGRWNGFELSEAAPVEQLV